MPSIPPSIPRYLARRRLPGGLLIHLVPHGDPQSLCGVLGGVWVYPDAISKPCTECNRIFSHPQLAEVPAPDDTHAEAMANRAPVPPEDPEYAPPGSLDPRGAPSQNFAAFADLVPAGGVPIHGIKIVKYIDENGAPAYRYRVFGDLDLPSNLGLIEWVKLRMGVGAWDADDEADPEADPEV